MDNPFFNKFPTIIIVEFLLEEEKIMSDLNTSNIPMADSVHEGQLKIKSLWVYEKEIVAILELEHVLRAGITVYPLGTKTVFSAVFIEDHHVVEISIKFNQCIAKKNIGNLNEYGILIIYHIKPT